MTRPPHIAQVSAEAARAALDDRALRPMALMLADGPAAVFVRAVTESHPPLQHLVPVLALARAAAGLALLFGDPALIDLVAVEGRRALRDGTVTIQDIFGRTDP